MVKVNVPPKNSQLVIHTMVTLLASAVDLIDEVTHLSTHLRSNEQHSSSQDQA